MLLLDSLYINYSVGKVLLDYLVEKLEVMIILFYYLFDERVTVYFEFIPEDRKEYLPAKAYQRFLFYKKNRRRFSKILCFGNFPPFIKKPNAVVYTYMHQPLYLKSTKNFIHEKYNLNGIVSLSLRKILLKLISQNTNLWMVQLPEIKKKMSDKYKINPNKIELLPFYT